MPSQREIRRRIGSVGNIKQITRAMQFVAASKLRRAQDATLASRPYSDKLDEVLADVAAVVDPEAHPLLAEAEIALSGEVRAGERRPEGPFGDHYGYYSLQHDYPVLRVHTLSRRRDAVFPATVVGKPRQEDFFIGDYLQELLDPLIHVVMPAVKQLWSYGETGYHALAAAVVKQRYRREAMASAFRILGEGVCDDDVGREDDLVTVRAGEQFTDGFDFVLVNGVLMVDGGKLTVLFRYLVETNTRVTVHFQFPANTEETVSLRMPLPPSGARIWSPLSASPRIAEATAPTSTAPTTKAPTPQKTTTPRAPIDVDAKAPTLPTKAAAEEVEALRAQARFMLEQASTMLSDAEREAACGALAVSVVLLPYLGILWTTAALIGLKGASLALIVRK